MLNKRIQNLSIITSFLFCLFFVVPVFAAESKFTADSIPSVGGVWRIHLVLNTPNEKINTIGGSVVFPSEILKVAQIETGKSIINLWVEEPKINNNIINFAGITPGGFQGENGEILTVVFEVLKKESGIIKFTNPEVYLNDGNGTKVEIKANEFSFIVGNGRGESKLIDLIPPQEFEISLGNSPSVFDGKWFAVFNAQDKETGIERYEIQESIEGVKEANWKIGTSPYLLLDQSLKNTIYVRAIDRNGNIATATLSPSTPSFSYRNLLFWGIISVLATGFFILWFYLRRTKNNR